MIENDIVIALTRPVIQSLNTVKMGILKNEDLPCLLNQRVCKLTNYKNATCKFIYHCLQSDNFTDYVKKSCTGSSQPNISTKDIANYEILNPPIELQNQFADFVKHIDKLKFTIKKSIEKLEICYKSLMQEYFG
jgi:type I restriction enzyme S subunit